MPEVSIIVPLYNKKEYVTDMLESVRSQSFQDYELILVDDGSTDGSGQIAERYAAHDERLRVVHIKNGGVSHARNIGLEMATGTYITFVDADDTLAPKYLENLYRCITENDVDLVISGVVKVRDDSSQSASVLPPFHGKKAWKDILQTFAQVQKESGIYGFCVAKVFPKSILDSIRFDEKLQLAEDFDFYLKLYNNVSTFFFDNAALYYYRQDTDNSPLSVADNEIDYNAQLEIQLRYASFLKANGVFTGQNKEIAERNLNTYLYLVLHYSEKELFIDRFKRLHELCQNEGIAIRGEGSRQRVMLFLLKHNRKYSAYYLFRCYYRIRNAIRRE